MSKMKFSLSTCLRFYNCSIAAGNMVAYKVILSNILPVCLWNEQMSKLSDLEPKKLIVFFWKIAHIFKGGSAWQPGHVSCDCKQWIPQVRLPVRCEFYMLWHGKYINKILILEIPKLNRLLFRTSTNVYLLNLAIADIVTLVFGKSLSRMR